MTGKMIQQANSPAATLIYRGSMIIAVTVFGWFANEFLTHKDDHSVSERELAVALTRLTAAVESLKEGTADRYTATTAKEDRLRMYDRISTISSEFSGQIKDLNERVRDLETDQR